MGTAIVVLLVIAVVAVLVALAWWASGRSRGAEHDPLATGERGDVEARTMKEHRPNSSAPLGPFG